MDMQNVSNLVVPEGEVKAIHDSNNRLLWGRVHYDVHLDGNAEQTTYSGKNKMPMATATMQAYNERQRNFRIDLPIDTYTVSFNLDSFELGTNTSFGINMQLRYEDGTQLDPTIITIDSSTTIGRKSYTFTTTKVVSSDSSLTQSNIRIAATSWNNGARAKLSNIQIESGSSMTSYEQYVGGIPSPNPDYPQDINVVTGEQNVKIEGSDGSQEFEVNLGKNLIQLNDVELTNQTVNYYREHSPQVNTTLVAGQTYTLSADVTIGGSVSEATFSVGAGTASYARDITALTHVTGGHITATFTPTETQLSSGDKLFIRFPRFGLTGVTGVDFSIKNVMLELGSQASSYSAYFTPIELAKIGTYQDYIWNDGGTWKVHKEIGKGTVTLGDTVYDLFGGTLKGSTYEPSNKNQTWQQEIRALCDKATNSTTYPNAQKWAGSFYENPANFMFIGTATDTSVTLKAKYDGATLYYLLATPTDTAITDTTLIAQLDAIYDWIRRYGYNAIAATPGGNLPIVIDRTPL